MATSFDLLVLLGDYSYDVQDEFGKNGDRYFDWMETIFTKAPIILTQGNHENFDNTEFFNNRFMMPGTREPVENNFFALEVHPAQFISLNLDYLMMNKHFLNIYLKFMRTSLSSFAKRKISHFSFFVTHRPFHCKANYEECENLSKEFRDIEELLSNEKVNVNLWGHVHHYERMKGVVGDQLEEKNNRISIISGSAGNKEVEEESVKKSKSFNCMIGLF